MSDLFCIIPHCVMMRVALFGWAMKNIWVAMTVVLAGVNGSWGTLARADGGLAIASSLGSVLLAVFSPMTSCNVDGCSALIESTQTAVDATYDSAISQTTRGQRKVLLAAIDDAAAFVAADGAEAPSQLLADALFQYRTLQLADARSDLDLSRELLAWGGN